ncbi:MAG: hypothetical protein ACAH80_01240 [Alphaproteobacteria bacterium]
MAAKLSTVEEVLAVLDQRGNGPVMRGGGSQPPEQRILLKDIEIDADAKTAVAIVNVSGWKFDAQGRTHKVERDFILSQEVAQRLSKEAGDHRLAFSVAASSMKSQLAKALKARQDALDSWCRDGAPTQADTKAMKPIKFKPPGQ